MAQYLVFLCESMENNKIVVLFPCTIQNIFIMSENNSKRTSMFFAPDKIKSRFFVVFSHRHCLFGCLVCGVHVVLPSCQAAPLIPLKQLRQHTITFVRMRMNLKSETRALRGKSTSFEKVGMFCSPVN